MPPDRRPPMNRWPPRQKRPLFLNMSKTTHRTRAILLIGTLLLPMLTLLLLLAAGCSHGPASPPPTPQKAAAAGAEFVDEAECHACHADICRTYTATHHAHTLRVADRAALGALAPPAQAIPGTAYSIRADGDLLRFLAPSGKEKERTMDLALGSGKLGMTYVSLNADNTLTELRMSWYPSRKTWYLTPGQEGLANNEPGELNQPDAARACLGCHAVTVPANGIRPEEKFFGVGCQSCHGPASAHVAAAKAGQFSDLHIERMGTWDATRINEMCGRCHRNPSKVGTSGDEVTMTQRFQPYGLMQSPCFQKSGGKLSCVTCHHPHDNVATNPRTYEAACLKCHSPSPTHAADNASAPPNRVCPVNPKEKCIGCHMPTRKVFPVSQIPIAMADHLIWAYHEKKPEIFGHP